MTGIPALATNDSKHAAGKALAADLRGGDERAYRKTPGRSSIERIVAHRLEMGTTSIIRRASPDQHPTSRRRIDRFRTRSR